MILSFQIRTFLAFMICFVSSSVLASERPIQLVTDNATCDYHRMANAGEDELQDVLETLISKKQPDLILLGETHFNSGTLRIHQVIHEIAKARGHRYCLFLEYHPSMLNWLLGLDFYKEVKAVSELDQMKIVLVDELKKVFPKEQSRNINARNHNMAKNIDSALQSKVCEKGVLVVGKAHNFSTINDHLVDSIQMILERDFGRTVASIDIIDSFMFKLDPSKNDFPPVDAEHTEANNFDSLMISCGSNPSTLKPNRGFIIEKNQNYCDLPRHFYDQYTGKEDADSEPMRGNWGAVCDYDSAIML